jgi:hypothetical protein
MKTHMKFFLLFMIFSLNANSQLLEQVKEGLVRGQIKNPESQLFQLKPSDPEFLDARLFMMNRRYQNLETDIARKHAKVGYKYSEDGSDKEYIFYDKMIKNKTFVELGFVDGNLYDTRSLFAEYSNNYKSTDWFKISAQLETRKDEPTGISTQGLSLGLGHIMVLDKYSYLDSNLTLSTLQDSFLPNYTISNELFYNPNNNTFSLRVKYSSFNSSSATFVSPHWRYDWENLYIGLRGFLTLAEITPGYAAQAFIGYKDVRYRFELSHTQGESIEDNILNQKLHYSEWGASANYRITPSTEIGLRYSDYFSDRTRNKGLFLNLLFRY